MGLLELEIIVGDFIIENSPKMTYEELMEFEEQVVDLENPVLNQYLIIGDALTEDHDSKWMRNLKSYLTLRKNSFGKYETHI